jgi:hypothetical protein
VASPTVASEIGAARQAGKTIIPLVEPGIDLSRFTFLQGLEWLESNRDNPKETLLKLSTRVASMKMSADQTRWVLLLLLGGLIIWRSRSE